MAHWRTRHLEAEIKLALKWSPCVVLLGMRQTGKTSLLQRLSKRYLTFDDNALPALFEREGDSILNQGGFPLVLDEVQKHPKAFDQIKMAIDRKKTPGRFLLTGSVRFSQKKDIRESLTGRTAPYQLLPLSLSEAYEKPQSNLFNEVLKYPPQKLLAKRGEKIWATISQIEHYKKTGGLPGICFKRDVKVRDKLFEQHLDTLLGRDIHLLLETKLPVTTLREILSYLYTQQGQPTRLATLARQFGYSAPTIRRILSAFEGLFLIRRISDTYYAEDQGLASFCSNSLPRNPLKSSWMGLLFHETRCQTAFIGAGIILTEYRTRGGAEVPFIVRIPRLGTIAITLDAQERVSEKSLKSLGSFAKKHRKEVRLIAFHLGEAAYLSTHRILCLPITWIA